MGTMSDPLATRTGSDNGFHVLMLLSVSNRLRDLGAIEARLLDLAHTTDAKLTATALAYYAPSSIEDAQRVLDDLTVKGTITMDVEDDGTIVYAMPGRQQFAARYAPSPRPLALVPFRPAHPPVHQIPRGASPLLAALLTLVIPGAGHLYAGRILGGIFWFMAVSLGYVLVLPGLILHLFAVVSATNAASRLEQRRHYALVTSQSQPYRLAA
jgi:TM2 domain-containing membrane protein YozV